MRYSLATDDAWSWQGTGPITTHRLWVWPRVSSNGHDTEPRVHWALWNLSEVSLECRSNIVDCGLGGVLEWDSKSNNLYGVRHAKDITKGIWGWFRAFRNLFLHFSFSSFSALFLPFPSVFYRLTDLQVAGLYPELLVDSGLSNYFLFVSVMHSVAT